MTVLDEQTVVTCDLFLPHGHHSLLEQSVLWIFYGENRSISGHNDSSVPIAQKPALHTTHVPYISILHLVGMFLFKFLILVCRLIRKHNGKCIVP